MVLRRAILEQPPVSMCVTITPGDFRSTKLTGCFVMPHETTCINRMDFDDQERVLREVHRALRPGGCLCSLRSIQKRPRSPLRPSAQRASLRSLLPTRRARACARGVTPRAAAAGWAQADQNPACDSDSGSEHDARTQVKARLGRAVSSAPARHMRTDGATRRKRRPARPSPGGAPRIPARANLIMPCPT